MAVHAEDDDGEYADLFQSSGEEYRSEDDVYVDDDEEEDDDDEHAELRAHLRGLAAGLEMEGGPPVTTVSWICEVCTFNNAPGTNYCQVCESDAPDQSDIDLNQVLECGLTLAQVEELQTRDISPEDFQVLLELDEKVPDRKSVV